MFYKIEVEDFIRVPPSQFEKDTRQAITEEISKKFTGYISKELGFVIDVVEVDEVKEGIVIPGDGASFYKTKFELLTFIPEMHEIVKGKIKDITDFGAFLSMGPIEAMIHISQTMNDFVSFSKEKVLQGKETNRSLKVGDLCHGRVIAISFKDPQNPKVGVTMRQDGLGKIEWIQDDLLGKKNPVKKEAKA